MVCSGVANAVLRRRPARHAGRLRVARPRRCRTRVGRLHRLRRRDVRARGRAAVLAVPVRRVVRPVPAVQAAVGRDHRRVGTDRSATATRPSSRASSGALETVTDGNRCYLAVEEQQVVSSILRAVPRRRRRPRGGPVPAAARPRPPEVRRLRRHPLRVRRAPGAQAARLDVRLISVRCDRFAHRSRSGHCAHRAHDGGRPPARTRLGGRLDRGDPPPALGPRVHLRRARTAGASLRRRHSIASARWRYHRRGPTCGSASTSPVTSRRPVATHAVASSTGTTRSSERITSTDVNGKWDRASGRGSRLLVPEERKLVQLLRPSRRTRRTRAQAA